MDSSPKSPNNKFVESGRKSQSESREKILVNSVKRKELHMHQYKKHSRLCPNSTINGLGFFLSFYYCISSTSLFLSVFLPFFFFFAFLPLFLLYTTCESGVESFPVPSRTSLNLLLLAVRLLVYCSGITSTLIRPESQLCSI